MMVDVQALIQYNVEVRHRYFATISKLPWEEIVKNREASWHSIRNIFVHTLSAVNHWLNFLQNENVHIETDFDHYKRLEDIQRLMTETETRMQMYLDSLTPTELSRKHAVTNDIGKTVAVTSEDILIHVFEEEVHHRGELIALLWQMGIEPPLMGWKFL
jgi:uncharacterized damage-inducible protein DinB